MGLFDKLPESKLQVVLHRGILNGSAGYLATGLRGGASDTPANPTLGESYYAVKNGAQPASDFRALICGFYVDVASAGETAIPNDVKVRVALEQLTPIAVPRASFLGAVDFTLPAGVGHIISEPIGISAAAHEVLISQMSMEVSSGQFWPASQLASTINGILALQFASVKTGSESQVGSFSWNGTGRTSGASPAVTAWLAKPKYNYPSVAITADSIGDGSGETSGDGFGNYGWICRGLYNVGNDNRAIPYIRISRPGDSFNTYTNASGNKGTRRLALLEYVSYLVSQMGTNDIANGTSFDNVKSRMQFMWQQGKNRGLKVYQCLIMPRSSSSDGWTTVNGQTANVAGFTVGGVRDQINDWIPTQVGQGLLDGYIDPNPYVESAPGSNKWLANMTGDGVHPLPAGHLAASTASRAFANALPNILI